MPLGAAREIAFGDVLARGSVLGQDVRDSLVVSWRFGSGARRGRLDDSDQSCVSRAALSASLQFRFRQVSDWNQAAASGLLASNC